MVFWPFEVTTPHIIYAVLGGFIVLFGMFSLLLRERLYIGEAIWAFLFGIIVGPYCANIFNPRAWSGGGDSEEVTNVITLEFSRVVLAIGVFAIGVELPKAYMKKHWKSLFFLLVPVMTWGWFVSAGLIYALIPGLDFLSSLAVAACLTPTDPILAAAVVGGKWADKHVPAHIRHLLAAESGCNDGAAFPFLFIALYLIIDKTTGSAIRDWFLILWLYQVLMGALIGSLIGFGFRHLMKFCERRDLIDRHSYVAQYVSLAILTIGITTLLGSDDLLAAFFCGTAFAWDGFFNKQTEESVFSSVIDILFNVAAFVFVGAWMPFNKFQDASLTLSVWRLLVIAILVLLLRRLPVMIALYKWIPDIKTLREAVFCGHFGPIGIGAVFISTLAIEVLHNAEEAEDRASGGATHESSRTQIQLLQATIQPIVAFMVLCSITIHGLSIPSFSLGRRVHSVSRTWSRRDTYTARGGAATIPEWATQARIVKRGEDIVINRDDDVDLEKGARTREMEIEAERSGGESSEVSDETKMHLSDTLVPPMDSAAQAEAEVVMATGTAMERRSSSSAHGHGVVPEVRHAHAYEQPQGHIELEDMREETTPGTPMPPQVQWTNSKRDYRDQEPPDGTETISEWMEGTHRVVERRLGPGCDVEVTVIDENPHSPNAFMPMTRWTGKMHEWERDAEDIGHAIRKELRGLGRRASEMVPRRSRGGSVDSRAEMEAERGAADPGAGAGSSKQQEDNETDTAIADEDAEDEEEDEDGWASETSASGGGAGLGQLERGKKDQERKSRSLKTAAAHGLFPHHSHKGGRRRPSFRHGSASTSTVMAPSPGGGAAAAEIVEEPRGRPDTTAPSASVVSFAATPTTSHPVGSGFFPRTTPAPSASTSAPSRLGGTGAGTNGGSTTRPSRSSRPGTADSSSGSVRNHRIETIKALHSRPPTRENSPSRSVRFVDEEGRAGAGAVSGTGNGNGGGGGGGGGRPLVDRQLVEEPSSSLLPRRYTEGEE